MRHEHDGLERPGLTRAGDGEVVSHEAGVDLAVVHRAGVHVGGLRSLRHQLGRGYLGCNAYISFLYRISASQICKFDQK